MGPAARSSAGRAPTRVGLVAGRHRCAASRRWPVTPTRGCSPGSRCGRPASRRRHDRGRRAAVGRLRAASASAIGAVQLLPTAPLTTLSVRSAGALSRTTCSPRRRPRSTCSVSASRSRSPRARRGRLGLLHRLVPGRRVRAAGGRAFVGSAGHRPRGSRRHRVATGPAAGSSSAVLLAIPIVEASSPTSWLDLPLLNGIRSPVRAYIVVALLIGVLAGMAVGRARHGDLGLAGSPGRGRGRDSRRRLRRDAGLAGLAPDGVRTLSCSAVHDLRRPRGVPDRPPWPRWHRPLAARRRARGRGRRCSPCSHRAAAGPATDRAAGRSRRWPCRSPLLRTAVEPVRRDAGRRRCPAATPFMTAARGARRTGSSRSTRRATTRACPTSLAADRRRRPRACSVRSTCGRRDGVLDRRPRRSGRPDAVRAPDRGRHGGHVRRALPGSRPFASPTQDAAVVLPRRGALQRAVLGARRRVDRRRSAARPGRSRPREATSIPSRRWRTVRPGDVSADGPDGLVAQVDAPADGYVGSIAPGGPGGARPSTARG